MTTNEQHTHMMGCLRVVTGKGKAGFYAKALVCSAWQVGYGENRDHAAQDLADRLNARFESRAWHVVQVETEAVA